MGNRECVVFDAAVGASGYVSGYTRELDRVHKYAAGPMPWLHISFRFHPGIADD